MPTTLTSLIAMPELVMLMKMVIAVIVGSVIGLERYQNGHPAGVRTFALICLTSALLTSSLTRGMYGQLMGEADQGASRIIQGILQGIGFIGAGVIMRDGASIKGLTSAASIWAVASTGVLVGCSEYFLAICGTTLTMFILIAFRRVDALMVRRSFAIVEATFVKDAFHSEKQLQDRFLAHGFTVSSIAFKGVKSGAMQVRAHVWILGNAASARSAVALDFLNDATIKAFSVEPVRE